MNLDHYFFQVSKLSEEQKRSSPKMEHFFSPNSGKDQKKGLHQKWNQVRSQKFAGGVNFWVPGAEPPAAEGQWGLGAPSPSAQKFCIFLQK